MSKVLVIHCSPRADRSQSRTLAKYFIEKWVAANPGDELTTRDLGHEPVPFISEGWVIGAFAPPEYQSPESKAAIGISDALVEEFLAADRYVFSMPMYNLSVPGNFKAYIDQIVRVGRTFTVTDKGYVGLVTGKKLLFVTASGGSFVEGSPGAAYNFEDPYLKAIFGFMGVTDVQFVVANNQNSTPELGELARSEAKAKLDGLITSW